MSEPAQTHRVTRLLSQMTNGDSSAREELITIVYGQLRKIAQVRLNAEAPGHTLQATELVHEAYLKLEPNMGQRGFRNRGEFYAAAGEAMRRILIDHARGRQAAKRGGGVQSLQLTDVAQLADESDSAAVLALNEAFEQLEAGYPELANLVRLRFFAGLGVVETANAMGISEASVKRRWHFARTLLFESMERNL